MKIQRKQLTNLILMVQVFNFNFFAYKPRSLREKLGGFVVTLKFPNVKFNYEKNSYKGR